MNEQKQPEKALNGGSRSSADPAETRELYRFLLLSLGLGQTRSWLSVVNDASKSEAGDEEIVTVLDELHAALARKGFQQVSAMMALVKVKEARPEMLLAVLRGTYTSRHLLQEWPRLLERVREAFRDRGLNGERLLRGLG